MRRAEHNPLRISYGAGAHNEGLGTGAGQISKSKFLYFLEKRKAAAFRFSYLSSRFMPVYINNNLINSKTATAAAAKYVSAAALSTFLASRCSWAETSPRETTCFMAR